MRTLLDEGNCLVDFQSVGPCQQQVSSKFKQKVLAALKQRDLLPSHRPVAGQRASGRQQPRQQQVAALTSNRRLARAAMEPPPNSNGNTSPDSSAREPQFCGPRAARESQHKLPPLDAALAARLEAPARRGGQYQAPAADSPRLARPLGPRPAAQPTPRSYPNNTLVEDLSRCHENLLPKVTRATARTVELVRACLPGEPLTCAGRAAAKRRSKCEPATSQSNGYVSQNISPTEANDDHVSVRQTGDNCDSDQSAGDTRPAPTSSRTRRKQTKFPMPESILKLNSTLHQDDYNRALCILTNDVRYQLHLLLYRRLQTIWTLFTTILCILIPIFCAAAAEKLVIMGACALWLGLQATGAAITRQFCKKLDQMLEKAVAQVNSFFMDHKLMVGVINVGGLLARARLVIPVLYFDTFQCREQIESILRVDLRRPSYADGAADKEVGQRWQQIKRRRKLALNYSKIGLCKIGPESRISFAQSQLAKKIILRYSQRWISYFDRRKLMFTDDRVKPRHLSTGKCLCQFVEEHFRHDDLEDEELELEADCASRPVVVNMPVGDELAVESRKVATVGQSDVGSSSGSSLGAECGSQPFDFLVPTLSHLVSLKERQEMFRGGLDSNNSLDSGQPNCFPSKLIHGFATHLQQERPDWSSSPATELSLDLAEPADLLGTGRNEELMRTLRSLLDARKAELPRGLDSPLSNTNKSSGNNNYFTYISRFSPNADEHRLKSGSTGGSTQTIHQQAEVQNSPIGQFGKKFFSQTDGFFFLSSKRSQQGVYSKQQQVLEIC